MPSTLTDRERETLDQARRLADAEGTDPEAARLLNELAILVYRKDAR